MDLSMPNIIKVTSDYKTNNTEEINPKQLTGTNLDIIGRAIWSGQRM